MEVLRTQTTEPELERKDGPESHHPESLSWRSIIGMMSFFLPHGMIFVVLGCFNYPIESESLFPTNQSTALSGMLLCSGAAMGFTPLMGKISDESTFPQGRRRPIIVVGSVLSIVFFIMMWFFSKFLCPTMYILTLLLNQISLAAVWSATNGLVSDLVPADNEGHASGCITVAALSGSIIGFLWIYLSSSHDVGSDGKPVEGKGFEMRNMYFVFTLSVFLSMLLTVWSVNEVPGTVRLPRLRRSATQTLLSDDTAPLQAGWHFHHLYIPSLGEVVDCYAMNFRGTRARDFNWVFASRLFFHMSISIITFMIYFLRDVVKLTTTGDKTRTLAIICLIGHSCSAIMAYPMARLSDICGRKPVIYVGCMVLVVSFGGIALASSMSKPLESLYCAAALYGIANGTFLSVDTALALDVLPNPHEAGKAFGILGVANFIGIILGPLMWTGCLRMGGSSSSSGGEIEHTQYYERGYYLLLAGAMYAATLCALSVRQVVAKGRSRSLSASIHSCEAVEKGTHRVTDTKDV